MKTSFELDLKSKTYCISKSYRRFNEKEISLNNFRFYQKLFVLLLSFTIILIIPESPRELGNICKDYNSQKLCNVW